MRRFVDRGGERARFSENAQSASDIFLEDDDDDDDKRADELIERPIERRQIGDFWARNDIERDEDEQTEQDLHRLSAADEHQDLVEQVPNDEDIDGKSNDIGRRKASKIR